MGLSRLMDACQADLQVAERDHTRRSSEPGCRPSGSAKVGNTNVDYDKAGVAIYRLNPPTITKVTNSKAGTATVTWRSVFGRTETNGAYDLQYATEADAKAGRWTNAKKLPGYAYNVNSVTVSGLKKGTKYIFRIRCSKTNKDRGTFYSEYSPWMSVTVK